MSEKEELMEEKPGEGLVFAPLPGPILPERLAETPVKEGKNRGWHVVESSRIKPNAGFFLGLFGCGLGLIVLVQTLLSSLILWVIGSGETPILGFFPVLAAMLFPGFVLAASLRREARLLVSSTGLRLEREDGAEEFSLDEMESVTIKPDKKLMVRLKGGREVTLPSAPWLTRNPPPLDLLIHWFRNHGIKVNPLAQLAKRVQAQKIYLPELHRPINWPKWGLGVVLVLLAIAFVASSVITELRLVRVYPELRTWTTFAPGAGVLLEFFFILAPTLLRHFPCKSTLEFVETGIRVTTKGVAEPILDHGSFKRFVIESRVDWFRVTRKRLCAETHYGRRIPLTGFALNWPLEAEQILHQAGERGIPVVLRREGDEKPLESP